MIDFADADKHPKFNFGLFRILRNFLDTSNNARQLRAEPAGEGGAVLPVVPGGRQRAGAGLQHRQPQGEVRLRDEEIGRGT